MRRKGYNMFDILYRNQTEKGVHRENYEDVN